MAGEKKSSSHSSHLLGFMVFSYCLKFKPRGALLLNLYITASSVLRRLFRFPVVCVKIVAKTSCTVWPLLVKWRETGLMTLPYLMSARWPRNLSLNVLPVCPMYCSPHSLQDMM